MEQRLTFHLAINGQARPHFLRSRAAIGRPADRIFTRTEPRPRPARPARKHPAPAVAHPVIRLQPLVSKPLQPYVLRETACDFLECRNVGRRCIASAGREVDLGYQVAYCLGTRHSSCPIYTDAVHPGRSRRGRKAVYATAALLMLGLIVVAAVQALDANAPVALGRAVGLG